MHPKERLKGIYLFAEMNGAGVVEEHICPGNWHYCAERNFLIDCGGSTAQFYDRLAAMKAAGCSQDFISMVKYARATGAKQVAVELD